MTDLETREVAAKLVCGYVQLLMELISMLDQLYTVTINENAD